MKVKQSVTAISSGPKGWIHLSSMLVATLLVSAPMPSWAAGFDDEEDDPYEDTPLVTQRHNEFINSVDVGLRYISDDAAKFGEYNSQNDKGWQLDGNVDLEQRDFEDGSAEYYKLRASSLGTQARELAVEGGKQGDYKLDFNYERMQRQVWGDFNTPYQQVNGGAELSLPVADPTQGVDKDVTYLASFIGSDQLQMERERIGLGGQKQFGKGWTFDADFQHETKQGHKDYSLYASGGSQPVIFALPIDYTTDTLDLSLEYAAQDYQVQIAYAISAFASELQSTTLDNPYNDGQDRLAQDPDNLYQMLSLNGNYRVTPKTRANLFVAYSRAEQDEALLPQGVNGVPAAANETPRTTAETEMNKLIARLGINSRISRELTLAAKYNYQENNSESDPFTTSYLGWDNGFPRPPATAPDFDTTWQSLELDGSYRLPNRSKLRAGYSREEIERPDQDREKTDEDIYWLSWKTPMRSAFSATLKYSYADRDGSINDADNISSIVKGSAQTQHADGSVRYTVADRVQNKYQINANYALSSVASVGAMLQLWNDDYAHTAFGLRELDGELYTLSLALRPSRSYGVSVYTGLQRFTYDQQSNAGTFIWNQQTEDRSLIAGLDLDWEAIPNRLALKLGYRYTDTRGEIDQQRDDADPVTPLADLESRVHTLELSGEYFLDMQTTLLARAVYEDYDSKNWAFDGFGGIVDTGSGTNYLGGGMDSPNHHAGVVELGLRYQF